MSSFEARAVDKNYDAIVQRVSSVMAIADELKVKKMIHDENYAEIMAGNTNMAKMRKLYEALNAGGDIVKKHFYYALRNHEPYLFAELSGDVMDCVDDSQYNQPQLK